MLVPSPKLSARRSAKFSLAASAAEFVLDVKKSPFCRSFEQDLMRGAVFVQNIHCLSRLEGRFERTMTKPSQYQMWSGFGPKRVFKEATILVRRQSVYIIVNRNCSRGSDSALLFSPLYRIVILIHSTRVRCGSRLSATPPMHPNLMYRL